MHTEEYDYAVFGSEVDAAFLSAILAQKHRARVLLVRDHVNDYALPTHFPASVGATADPDTAVVLLESENSWSEVFSSRDGKACFSRQNLNLEVAFDENAIALNYVENTLLGAGRQCDRKATSSGREFLELRNVIIPDRKKCLEYLFNTAGGQITFADRSEFTDIRRLKSGQLNLKSDRTKISARQTILLDYDAILKEFDSTLPSQICAISLQSVLVDPATAIFSDNVRFVDCLGAFHPNNSNKVEISSSLAADHLLGVVDARTRFGEAAQVIAKARKNALFTQDGAPFASFVNAKKLWTFVGDPSSSAFLMPSLASHVANENNQSASDFWGTRGDRARRAGDIGALSIDMEKNHANP